MINMLIFVLVLAGAIVLQIFLSKKESKWPGLLLPTITLLFSILVVLGISVYTTFTTSTQITQNGKAIMNAVNHYSTATILTALYVLVLYNIPTAVLLGIYFACREKRKRNREIEKMNVQDLE
jgi:cytochrome bd-type quinol oxidase subunit 2